MALVETADRLDLARSAAMDTNEVLAALRSDAGGLSSSEAARRLAAVGPNAVRTHHARLWAVLGRQLRSPLLLLVVTASLSFFLGDRADALIIGSILALRVGLGFHNEYRAWTSA